MEIKQDENGLQIANEIRQQIGNRCFAMLGAQHLAGGSNYLSFKIRGSRKVTHIKITLDSDDTYTMTFYRITPTKHETVEELQHIYSDQLHEMIRDVTGLDTNL